VGELDEQVERLLTIGLAVKNEGGIIINIDDIGAMKLLGSGKVTHQLIVKARSWSNSAAMKIEKAGGQISTIENKMIEE
jgi:ribosomal protein L15